MKVKIILAMTFLWVNTSFAQKQKPKLILHITIDQLRGDLPYKFMKNMGEGGFRNLKGNGIWYSNAHYGHTYTKTVVGHTALATGADPSFNGMISNVWFDREKGWLRRCMLPDSYVPVIFAGSHLKAQRIVRKTKPRGIASTLASILGSKPPSGADGEVLYEVINQFGNQKLGA